MIDFHTRKLGRLIGAVQAVGHGLTRAMMIGAAMLMFAGVALAEDAAPFTAPPLAYGAAWYPEQWPETQWDTDLALMQRANMNVVRIGEFAWSRLEPSEGQFDFGWMDRAIEAAARRGMVVVLGTPSAAPPAWLTAQYPDTLRIDEQGVRAEHGGRRHFSFASSRYRMLAERMAGKMAERYGHNPNVVGWQIDNEIGPASFDPEARTLWAAWLRQRYGDIGTLNTRWTTNYWSQTYDNFEQVPLRATGQHNPGLLLDFKHFVTDTWASYVNGQAAAIRTHSDPRQFVTTNTMYWNAGYDHAVLHRGLDIAAWDNYIQTGRADWVENGGAHDTVRGYKNRNFWVMETQAGHTDWAPINRALDRGQVREMAWQAVGHGADAFLYWQWRSALNGQEQYYGVVAGPDGLPTYIFDEIAQVGDEFARAAPVLDGTTPKSRVAMVMSYDSRWAIDIQRHHRDFDPMKEFLSYYRPLRTQAQAVDIIAPDAPLSDYRLVVAPALNVMSVEDAARLEAYVRAGGHLVLGPRSGMKDEYNALQVQRQPGPLVDLLGGRVEQFYALDEPVALSGVLGDGQARIWGEALTPRSTETDVLMRYGQPGGWLDGEAGVLTRQVGAGRITYVGAWMDDALMQALTTRLMAEAGVQPILPGAPEGVEVAERTGADHRALILINHTTAPKVVDLPHAMNDVLRDRRVSGRLELAPHDVVVLQEPI